MPPPATDTRTPATSRQLVSYNRVAPDFFDAFDIRVLAGRAFDAADASDASAAVIVNRTFVETVRGGGAALIVRLRGANASAYVRRLRALALEIDAALQLDDPIAMDDAGREWRNLTRMIALGVLAATLSVILLSAAGIYAMMSFTVARRRREIGIRVGLGAPPAQLLRAVFSRAAAQLTAGVLIGLALAAVLDHGLDAGYAALLAPVAALMLTVGLLAAAGPARRGLRIQPTEALRED